MIEICNLFLLILIIIIHLSFCCLPTIDDLPPPIVHRECLDRRQACQIGYFCGPYGCTKRRKTFGVKNVNSQSSESQNLETFDDKFGRCCSINMLPESCRQFCTFSSYNMTSISIIFSDSFGCSLSALPVIHFCASQNLDHQECCENNNVPSDCAIFCAPTTKLIKLNASKLHCLQYLSNFKQCFRDKIK